MKFKHGDKVTCTINGVDIKDARISINEDGDTYICQNVKRGNLANDLLGYKYSWVLLADFTSVCVSNLCLAEKTWDNLAVGDEVMGSGIHAVLGVCDRMVFLSYTDLRDNYHFASTKEQLIKNGYTIIQDAPEEPLEVTMSEVCEKFGRNVKIKKD
jgi:hypothetical protein